MIRSCDICRQIVLPAILSTAVLVAVGVAMLYRFRVEVFIHFNVHPFDVDECDGEPMQHDVLVSYADEDHAIGRRLVERLETGAREPEETPSYNETDQLLPLRTSHNTRYAVCDLHRLCGRGIIESMTEAV